MKLCFVAVIAGGVLIFAGCQSVPQAPPVVPDPVTETIVVTEPAPIGTVRVNASALNIRSEPSMSGEVLAQVDRGNDLPLLEAGESWMMVRLPDGRTGWAASRFLLRDGEKPVSPAQSRGNCPPDSDFAFASAPTPTFSDWELRADRGTVVVEVHVDAEGKVTSTKVIGNTTGDEALASRAEQEIASATFIAPVRNCVPIAFIYTYERSF
jgi:TonB family protein